MRESPIIIALDGISRKEALAIANTLKGLVWGFKINDLLFDDIEIIKKLKKFGRVFADAKLHDIPNTVANGVTRLSKAGADIITVHASGGIEMMKAANKVAGPSKIMAVTVLTSRKGNMRNAVLKLAQEAQSAHLNGIICSARELKYLSHVKLLKIVPGIRPTWYTSRDDQDRTGTPKEAILAGADLLIIGRPITKAKDPMKAIKKIIAEIENA